MAAPTTAEVKIFLAIPAALTTYDATIAAQIAEANEAVKDDGIEDGNAQHKRAVTLKTAVMIAAVPALATLIKTNETNSSVSTGDIKKEKVADVEIEYFPDSQSNNAGGGKAGGNVSQWPGGNYERDYLRLIKDVAAKADDMYQFGI